MALDFVHLRVHSEYSLVDGLVRIKPLVEAAARSGMPAVGLTDHANLFGMVKFYKAAMAAGVKPIIGVDAWLQNPADVNKPFRLTLLVQNQTGYRNLTRLVSRAYLEGQHLGEPRLRREWVEEAGTGLILLSGGREGDVGQALLAGHADLAGQLVQRWLQLFPDRYYLELVRTSRSQEEECLHLSVDLAAGFDVPVVATNDVRFLAREEYEAHEARVCIHEGRILDDPRRPRRYTEWQYLRSPAEMRELFADIPEALENSVELAKRCTLELTLGKNYLPASPVPAGVEPTNYFADLSRQGLERRLTEILDPAVADYAERRRGYLERLETEIGVITRMGFGGYFLIVADFIRWAKDNNIPVGPGRGSGAGSLVAYSLGITDLDPIAQDLLFERFLNPERVSMPDFDIDFCMEGRDRVIDYVSHRYGRESVSQIVTHGSMAAKAVVRDVGRVLGHPYPFVDGIAKLVPFEIGMTLERALEQSEELSQRYRNDEEVQTLIDLARKLEGIARNVGKHAGGVVIAPTVLTDFSPLYCEAGGGNLVTQFDKDDVEAIGLVKFDFLGLRTLTIIDWALKRVNRERMQTGLPVINIARIPMDDAEAFKLLKRGETTAVFQLESRGMKELIKKLQPDCFDEITALVALYRPGPLQSGMVDDFINRKHGRAAVSYPHPKLEPILKPTYGVILYQEQVMQIAQVLAGYTLGGADLLRRAMGKKKPEEMEKQRSVFTEGAVAAGVAQDTATYIFDLMEKFAGYGFNKTLHCDTLIRTATGIKRIEDCQAGDRVIAFNPDGSLSHTRVVARHDHGLVPLWEIIFDDGTLERCTLDHKWLTRHGQLPLWAIIQMGEQVWGSTIYQTRYPRPPERMSPVHGHDPYRPVIGQGADHALWRKSTHTRKSHRAFSPMPDMPGDTPPNSAGHLQKPGTYRSDAEKKCGNCEENLGTAGYSSGTGRAPQALAAEQSRAFSGNPGQSAWLAQTLENGGMAGAASGASRVCQKYPPALRRHVKTSGLYRPAAQYRHRSGWSLAFSPRALARVVEQSPAAGSPVGAGNTQTVLALNPAFDGMFQKQIWRTYVAQPRPNIGTGGRWQLDGHTVLRQPVRATFLGWQQGYDLEVAHQEHNFLLASGLCCSNSHSAAYALVSYQTLWLKTHYPAAFMAAVLSSDMDNTDKVVGFIEECRIMGLRVEPPDVNHSEYRFSADGEARILYGLGAIKGVGQSAIEGIQEARNSGGPFRDLFDFCRRIDLRRANRRVLEAMIRAGAMDCLGKNRATLMSQLPLALRAAEQFENMRLVGQDDLFGMTEPHAEGGVLGLVPSEEPEWQEDIRLQGEKETLGLYLTGHPIERYRKELDQIVTARLGDLADEPPVRTSGFGNGRNEPATIVAGLVVAMRQNRTQRGRMASLTLDDRSGRLEVTAFTEVYERHRELIAPDRILVISGHLGYDEFRGAVSLRAERLWTMEQAREGFGSHLQLLIDHSGPSPALAGGSQLREFTQLLHEFAGGVCPLRIDYLSTEAKVSLSLAQEWRIAPRDELLKRLERLLGPGKVEMLYNKTPRAIPEGNPQRAGAG